MFHTIEQRRISEAVINRAMKPEDSRLIREFFCQADEPPQSPGSRDALFYPSSGDDILTPLLLGLPFCSQFFFYDRFIKRNGQRFENQIKEYLDRMALPGSLQRSAQERTSQAWLRLFL